jgi:hypothetical protein
VDPATGVLSAAVTMHESFRALRLEQHPDTGAAIAGIRLPHRPESVALALRAHQMLGGIACVGWDVAILDDGPVMLEGNWNPGVRAVQMSSRVPLDETAYARGLAEHLEARLGSPRLTSRSCAGTRSGSR